MPSVEIRLDHKPADCFTHDKRKLLWINSLRDKFTANGKYRRLGIGPSAISAWIAKGCWELDGEKPTIYVVHYPERRGERHFVDLSFLDRVARARETTMVSADEFNVDPERLNIDRAVAMGFPLEFLTKYSDYESPRRKIIGQKHPHFRRPIRSGIVFVTDHGVPRWRQPWFSKTDLDALLKIPPPDSKLWVAWENLETFGVDRHAMASLENKPLARLNGEYLKFEWFPSVSGSGKRGAMKKYWWRAHIENIGHDLLRPGSRVYIDPVDSSRWFPVLEAGAITGTCGTNLRQYIGKPNSAWGGLVLMPRTVKFPSHKAMDKPMLVVSEIQCITIQRRLAGLPDPAPAIAGQNHAAIVGRLNDIHESTVSLHAKSDRIISVTKSTRKNVRKIHDAVATGLDETRTLFSELSAVESPAADNCKHYQAGHYKITYGIPPDRLKQQRAAGHHPNAELRGRNWFYHINDVKKMNPQHF